MASWVIGSGADWLKGGKYNFTDPAVVKAVDNWRQSVGYAPKGTNSATARQLFVDGKVAFLRDGPWVWGAVEKASAENKPNLRITGPAVPGDAGRREQQPAPRGEDRSGEEGGRVELHPDGGVARVAAQVRADRLAGAAQGRGDRGRHRREAAAQGRQRRGGEGAQPVPRGAGGARELQRLRHAGHQGRDEDDLDAGADGEGAGGSAGGAGAAGPSEVGEWMPCGSGFSRTMFVRLKPDPQGLRHGESHAEIRRAAARLAAADCRRSRRSRCSSRGRSTSSCR